MHRLRLAITSQSKPDSASVAAISAICGVKG
jgi:hypothetical protein